MRKACSPVPCLIVTWHRSSLAREPDIPGKTCAVAYKEAGSPPIKQSLSLLEEGGLFLQMLFSAEPVLA